MVWLRYRLKRTLSSIVCDYLWTDTFCFKLTLQTGSVYPDLGTAVMLKNARAWIYIGLQSKRAALLVFFFLISHCHRKEGFHLQQLYFKGFIQKLHQWILVSVNDSWFNDFWHCMYWGIHTKTPWTILVHSPVLYHSISACQVSMPNIYQHLESIYCTEMCGCLCSDPLIPH